MSWESECFEYKVGDYMRSLTIKIDHGYTIERSKYTSSGGRKLLSIVNMTRERMIEEVRSDDDYRFFAKKFEEALSRIP